VSQSLLAVLLLLQVWVRQTVVENDLNLFKELPTHLRAQVAWRSNKSIMDKLDTFQVCCQFFRRAHWDNAKPCVLALAPSVTLGTSMHIWAVPLLLRAGMLSCSSTSFLDMSCQTVHAAQLVNKAVR